MSQRETQLSSSTQQWRGVNQRAQPTLLQDGFFVMARGVFFNAGDAARIPGKRLSGQLGTPVFNIYQFGRLAIVQTMNKVYLVEVSELVGYLITFVPGVPIAPTLNGITDVNIDVTMPIVLPEHTDSFTLQRSLDNFTWATIATGLASLQVFHDNALTPSTLYYYRLLAVNIDNSTAGPSSNAPTLAPSTNNRLLEDGDIRITETGDNRITE
jgi:hypothetical protein